LEQFRKDINIGKRKWMCDWLTPLKDEGQGVKCGKYVAIKEGTEVLMKSQLNADQYSTYVCRKGAIVLKEMNPGCEGKLNPQH